MRWKWMPGVLLTAAIASPGSAQISGYWRPVGHHYKWVRGHWERPPYEGAYWTHPHYDHYREGWEWHEGYWDHEDHDNVCRNK